jgi:predicted enzyme related to lactoylglutathione lyase
MGQDCAEGLPYASAERRRDTAWLIDLAGACQQRLLPWPAADMGCQQQAVEPWGASIGGAEQEISMDNKVVWFEVLGRDAGALKRFYGELFNWSFKEAPGMNYGMTDPEATGIGGGVGASPSNSSWATFYVGVENIDQALARAQQLGATVLTPVTKLPDVTLAVFADPEGHPIGLVEQRGKASGK